LILLGRLTVGERYSFRGIKITRDGARTHAVPRCPAHHTHRLRQVWCRGRPTAVGSHKTRTREAVVCDCVCLDVLSATPLVFGFGVKG